VKLPDLIDKRRARELVRHYARQAGISNVDEAAVLKTADAHFQGLMAEWRRHGIDDAAIHATLKTQPVAEWLIDRAIQDYGRPPKGGWRP
jgi:hypothetical protein